MHRIGLATPHFSELSMSVSRKPLPQASGGRLFLTDGGLETTLIFHHGIDLPCFAACDLMRTAAGRAVLRGYYEQYIATAHGHGYGFLLDSPTWRANPDWGAKLGYTSETLAEVNRDSIALMHELRAAHGQSRQTMIVSGAIGPRGDGYVAEARMTAAEAADYHGWQIAVLADAGADMVSAYTMTNVAEALGVTRAAQEHDIPAAISFTLETDGRLPSGEPLDEAIRAIDAATDSGPAYYMINCAHPTHFAGVLAEGGAWRERVQGIRANASTRSHDELNEATDLDAGDPHELGRQYRELLEVLPHLRVLGGCCGTDHRHVACIGEACRDAGQAQPRPSS